MCIRDRSETIGRSSSSPQRCGRDRWVKRIWAPVSWRGDMATWTIAANEWLLHRGSEACIWPKRSARPVESVSQETVGFAVLPYIYGVTDHIGRLIIYKPTRKFLRPVKEGRLCMSCLCSEVYIGTMKCSVCTQVSEHSRCCRLRQLCLLYTSRCV